MPPLLLFSPPQTKLRLHFVSVFLIVNSLCSTLHSLFQCCRPERSAARGDEKFHQAAGLHRIILFCASLNPVQGCSLTETDIILYESRVFITHHTYTLASWQQNNVQTHRATQNGICISNSFFISRHRL